jgi:ceramide glucosyltransferase
MITAVQTILLLAFGCYVLWIMFIHACTWRYFARKNPYPPTAAYAPAVSIIKPTKGVDQSAFENFASFCEQTYNGEYELLFCVEDVADPAVPVITRVIDAYPNRNVRLVFSDVNDTRSFGKLKNLIAGVEASTYDVIIFSDSDARVGPMFLQETVPCLQDPVVGLAFAAPAYGGAENWAAALRSLFVNELVLRITTLCSLGVFRGAIGTTMVMRKTVLWEIGGLAQFGWQISDDISLARAIHEHGLRVHLLAQPVHIVHRYDSFVGWWWHVQRWLVMTRRHWPTLFVLMNLPDLAVWWSFLYLGIALVSNQSLVFALLLMLAVLATTLVSAAVVNAQVIRNGQLWRFLWLVPFQEAVRLPLVAYSWMTNAVIWRGRKMHVNRDCSVRMLPLRTTHNNV